MKAIILAAGRGSRLAGYSEDRPKSLNTLSGVPIIERQIATLQNGGVDDITIVTGYRADQLILPGTAQVHNPDWQTTNMVESLFCAEVIFTDDLLICYADIVYEPKVLRAIQDSPHDVSVIVDRNWKAYWDWRFADPLSDAESLRLSANGQITDIGNKASTIDEIEAQYIGLIKISKVGLSALAQARRGVIENDRPWKQKRDVKQAYMTDVLMEMILLGLPVHGVRIDGGWLEFDTTEDYENAERLAAIGELAQFFDLDAI